MFLLLLGWFLGFSLAAFEEIFFPPAVLDRGPSSICCSLFHYPLQFQRRKRVLKFDTEPLLQVMCGYYSVRHSNLLFI